MRRRSWTMVALLMLATPHPGWGAEGEGTIVGGALAQSPDVFERWCWSGAWNYPVGNPLDYTSADPDGAPGFHVLRGVLNAADGSTHEGVDLANRRGGDRVHAAASGLVVNVGFEAGYGNYVILAHRLPGADATYSVYAHLVSGSAQVRPGDFVAAGALLGGVGRTGRASTEHLHFEVRQARRWDSAWELGTVVDPLDFVQQRLPSADSSAAGPWLRWARAMELVPGDIAADAPLERSLWWNMLARAARHPLLDLPADLRALRILLAGLGLETEKRAPHRIVPWSEMRGDLTRLAAIGLRLPRGPEATDGRAVETPRPGPRPTIFDACTAIAALTGPGSFTSASSP